MNVTRRRAVGGLLAAPGLIPTLGPAFARAPVVGRQAASIFRVKVGTIEVTALHDGGLALPGAAFLGDASVVAATLAAAGQPDPVPTPVLAFLVNTGDRLVLVDTGYRDQGGPSAGRLPAQLAAAGVRPEDVDVVALTHAHPDHVAGAVGAGGRAAFPNAELVVAEAEIAFWTSDSMLAQAPADARPFFALARDGLAPYAARTRRIADGAEIAPGVTAVAAPGHTPGHTMFRVSSGGAQLLVFGDIVHSAAIQFARPEISMAFDTDPAMAAATRKRVFDMAATDRLAFAGAHVPFPGVGTAVRDGAAFRHVPTLWGADL